MDNQDREQTNNERQKTVKRTGQSPIVRYKNWMFSGGIFVPFKVVWTGMWIISMLTFQITETLVLWGVGIALTYGRDEIKNWHIKWDEI